MVTVDLPDQLLIEDIQRRRGERLTPQRAAVLAYFCSNGVHPDARAVYAGLWEALLHLSLGTVYRSLAVLRDAGPIQELAGGPVARYDANRSAHDHLHCQMCGRVEDLAPVPLASLPEVEARGFRILGHRLASQGSGPDGRQEC